MLCKDSSRVTRIDFIEKGQHIRYCQWIQEEKGKLIIQIVPDQGFTERDRLFLLKETEKRVGRNNMDIETKITTSEELICSHNGKFKLIINKLQNPEL